MLSKLKGLSAGSNLASYFGTFFRERQRAGLFANEAERVQPIVRNHRSCHSVVFRPNDGAPDRFD